jgi:hypothetical protein
MSLVFLALLSVFVPVPALFHWLLMQINRAGFKNAMHKEVREVMASVLAPVSVMFQRVH